MSAIATFCRRSSSLTLTSADILLAACSTLLLTASNCAIPSAVDDQSSISFSMSSIVMLSAIGLMPPLHVCAFRLKLFESLLVINDVAAAFSPIDIRASRFERSIFFAVDATVCAR